MLPTLATIWFLHVAAMMSPGANMLLVSQLAASDRARSAVFAALGITAGAAIWSSCAVLGINVLFHALPALRFGLQIAGGLYLLYVASRLWRSKPTAETNSDVTVSRSAAFRMGFLTNITNPKSALFFSSVFASSFPAAPSHALQVTAVAMIVFNALCWHTLLAYLFSRHRIRLAYSNTRTGANRIASAALGILGVGLLLAALRESDS